MSLANRVARFAVIAAAAALASKAPAQVTCATAGVMPGSGPFPFTTTLNTSSYSTADQKVLFPGCNPSIEVSRIAWYSFTPTVTDAYRIDTFGTTPASDYDTLIQVFTGICGTLVAVPAGCNNDSSGTSQSTVDIAMTAGTTYVIAIGGLGSLNPFNQNQVIPSPGGNLKVTINRVPIDYAHSYVIPSVAKLPGLGGAVFVSDLYATNLESQGGQFTVQFLGHANSLSDAVPPANQPFLANPTQIGPNGTKAFADIVGQFNVGNDFGAIQVSSTRRLTVGAKTSTAAGTGTNGQFAQATKTTELLSQGETGFVTGVREDASFRTNVVFVNASNQKCNVDVKLVGENGSTLAATQSPSLPPRTMFQASRVVSAFFGVSSAVTTASVQMTSKTAGCQVGMIGYVIDNATNDPFAVTMLK